MSEVLLDERSQELMMGVDKDEGGFFMPPFGQQNDRYAEKLNSSFMRKYTLRKEPKQEE